MNLPPTPFPFETSLVSMLLHSTEQAALATQPWRGRGDNHQADQAAVNAMRASFKNIPMCGRVVIGEGERDKAPMLYIGEEVGTGFGPELDIALDPLEGTTLTAKDMPGAMSVMAIAPRGGLLHAPDVYMNKMAVALPVDKMPLDDIDLPLEELIKIIAHFMDVAVSSIRVCVLERKRHETIIESVRQLGARVHLITDGDISGVLQVSLPTSFGVDIYSGIGGAPEGVLAAAALKSLGGQMLGRLIFDTEQHRRRARELGIKDLEKTYTMEELVSPDVLFIATGVTSGPLLNGVEIKGDTAILHSLLCYKGRCRWITTHRPR